MWTCKFKLFFLRKPQFFERDVWKHTAFYGLYDQMVHNGTPGTVFPNPSEHGIVYLTNTHGIAITSIEMFNQMGQVVKKFPQHNPKTLIELNHDAIPSGLYFLRIVSPNFTQTQSIILK